MSALDRILTSKGKSGGRVKGRGTVTNRESRRSTPYETTGQKTSILDRLGNQETAKPLRASGTSVTISNLNPDITAQDISELCATVGSVKSVMMQFDSAGRSTGTAEVVFERRSDAMTCVTKFNKVNLDNTPMSVSLTEEIGVYTHIFLVSHLISFTPYYLSFSKVDRAPNLPSTQPQLVRMFAKDCLEPLLKTRCRDISVSIVINLLRH
jgi:RNA recognition motif-containing protein